MRRFTIAITGAAALLAACSSSGGKQAETAPTTVASSSTTATTAAPTTTTQPHTTSEIGKTKPFNGDDGTYKTSARLGVLDYSDNAVLPSYRNEPDLTRPGYKFVAIQVRFCLVSTNYPDDVTVNWATWSLNGKDGTTIEPSGSYSPDVLIAPLYPDGKVTPVGTCRKGWIPFEVPAKWRPDFIEYAPEDGRLTWRL